jgi:membrane-associated protease RseP (regulator of RpoE activity)
MRISALRIPLLALLILVPTASRLSAGADPPPAPEKDAKKKKTIVVHSPEKEIVIDGDRVAVWNDGDEPEEIVADLPELDEKELSRILHFHGLTGGYLGVTSVELTPELRQHFGAPKEAGVLVGTVEPDSPAAKAGVLVGDIITAVDGEKIDSSRDLSRSVRRHKEGEKVKIDLLRDRSPKSLQATLVERKGRELRLGDFGPGLRKFRFGSKDWDFDGPAVAPVPPVPPVAPVPPDAPRWNGLRERLDSLEKRLKELESRLPAP